MVQSIDHRSPTRSRLYQRSLIVLLILVVSLIGGEATSVEKNVSRNDNNKTSRVAVVTGGNKGIGYAIVKGLCEQFDGIVYLTARNEARGLAAVEKLNKIGLRPRFHQLDVTDDVSVERFRNYLNETHGRLDVLANNAGIVPKDSDTIGQRAATTIGVNYFGVLRVSNALFPLLRPHARVVQTSSQLGHLSYVPGSDLRARLSNPQLTYAELNRIMEDFVDAAQNGTYSELGWGNHRYVIYIASKVGVSAMTRIQQRDFDADPREDVVVNSVHPGYVKTDINDGAGVLTTDEGAQAPLYLALLPKNTPIKGAFVWQDKTPIDWVNGTLPSRV